MRLLWITFAMLSGQFPFQVDAQNPPKPPLTKDAYQRVLENIGDDAVFENVLLGLGTVTIGDETKRTYYEPAMATS
jgi:hypothetical protein